MVGVVPRRIRPEDRHDPQVLGAVADHHQPLGQLLGKRRVDHQGAAGSSVTVDLDDGLGKGLRSFLRHIVADVSEDLVRVLSGELLAVRRSV
jgi:hypothetical protein